MANIEEYRLITVQLQLIVVTQQTMQTLQVRMDTTLEQELEMQVMIQ